MKILSAILIALSILLTANNTLAQNSTYCSGPVIIMEAEGVVESIPDIATFHINLSSQEKDKDEALLKLTENINSVLSVLSSLNIRDENIQSETIEISEIYEEDEDNDDVLVGYEGVARLNFKIIKFDNLSDIISEIITASGNLVNNISFSTSNEKELQNDARKIAFKNVVEKAKLYSELSGNKLGKACTITESKAETITEEYEIYGATIFNNRWNTNTQDNTTSIVSSRMAPKIPVKPGKIETLASVTVVYQLEN